MDRISFIHDLAGNQSLWWRKGFTRAFVAALGPTRVCALLATCGWPSIEFRDALLKSVLDDFKYGLSTKTHLQMVSRLIQRLETTAPNRRQSGAFVLREIFPSLPGREQRVVLRYFLQSSYPSFRKRAYALARAHPLAVDWLRVVEAWRRFADPTALAVILRCAPANLIETNFRELRKAARHANLLRLLVQRRTRRAPQLLAELRRHDEISYVYVLARQGRRLAVAEATSIFTRNIADPRIGILVWSFGKMRLWKALTFALSKSEAMRKIDIRRAYSHLDPDPLAQFPVVERVEVGT